MNNQQFVAITGAAGGLGVEFTKQFIKQGFHG